MTQDSKIKDYDLEMYDKLDRLQLSKNEIKIYLTLLRIGSAKAGKIAKESQRDRSSVYNALDSLVKKGLVSTVIDGKTKIFSAGNPNKLIEYFQEKQEIAKTIMPQLEGLFYQSKEKSNITLFKGYRGIKNIFQEVLREGKENLVWGSEGQFSKKMPYYAPQFVKQLEQKKIKIRSLVREDRDDKPSMTTTTRTVPKSIKSNVTTSVFGDKVSIIIWTSTPQAVLIENPTVAQSYKSYFEFMWQHAKPYKKK